MSQISFYLQSDTVEYLENKMVAQESVIANVELRNCFSLHCLHMETQLVHAHLEILATVLQSLVNVQIRGHSEVRFLHDTYISYNILYYDNFYRVYAIKNKRKQKKKKTRIW